MAMISPKSFSLKYKRILLYLKIWLSKRSRESHSFDIVDSGFLCILLCSVLALLYMVSEISISYKEARNLLVDDSLLYSWVRLCIEIFGSNDYALRGSFIALHCINMTLMYKIGRIYLRRSSDSLLLVLIYALLPGINIASLFICASNAILFILLLICYIQLAFKRIPYVLIFTAGLLDFVFCSLFAALIIYAIKHRYTKTLFAALIGFGINMFLYSSASVGGVPKGYFLDILGGMAMLFSPLLFLYYIYTLYAAALRRKEDSLMVLVSISSIVLTLLLSLRQPIDLTKFVPLCIIGLPVLVFGFYNDMRVRLRIYQMRFRVRMGLVFFALVIECAFLFGNKISYIFSPSRNFASSFYFAKDIANALKANNTTHIKIQDSKLALRLGFYGISAGKEGCLYSGTPPKSAQNTPKNTHKIQVIYVNKIVASYTLVKSNACTI